MKRSALPVIALCVVLLLNIVCTQYAVNTFFYEKYDLTLLFTLANLILFPLSIVIYRRGSRS
ncbi:hypothetical protein MO973_13365 [Paenibacillus sp. TRM 82003]|nr:hypothetical protein [Paenibacillus sp. TRM 82003]